MTGVPAPAPAPALPGDPEAVRAAAAAIGLAIPDACLAGVLANLALLATHAARIPAGDDAA